MHAPIYKQSIITDLLYQIITYVEGAHEPYKVITSPFYLLPDKYPVAIYPDIAIIRYPEKLTTLQIKIIPLFIAEIAITKAQHTDDIAKLKLYKELGIKEYWIINWANKTLSTYEICSNKEWSVKKHVLPCKIPTSVLPRLELCLNFN